MDARTLSRLVACWLVALSIAIVTPRLAHAVTALVALRYSADVTTKLGGLTVNDEDVVEDDLHGNRHVVNLGPLPAGTDVIGYHQDGNDHLLSFDTTIALPGGLTVHPGDVVRYDGSIYTLEFDAAAAGVPPGTMTDAITMSGRNLILSFDKTVNVGGVKVDDDDLVLYDGTSFSLFFDGATTGVPDELDIDAADLIQTNGHLLLSFDGSGVIDGVSFDDEDVLEYDPATGDWALAYDGSAADPAWANADLDAVSAVVAAPATPTPVVSPTVVPTNTPTPTRTPTPTPTPTPTRTPTPGRSVTPTRTPTPVVKAGVSGEWESIDQDCKKEDEKMKCTLSGVLRVFDPAAAPAGRSVVHFFLSSDPVLDDSDPFIAAEKVGRLDPGASEMVSLRVKLPRGESASGKYVIAFVDATNQVDEANEDNNVTASPQIP